MGFGGFVIVFWFVVLRVCCWVLVVIVGVARLMFLSFLLFLDITRYGWLVFCFVCLGCVVVLIWCLGGLGLVVGWWFWLLCLLGFWVGLGFELWVGLLVGLWVVLRLGLWVVLRLNLWVGWVYLGIW